MIDQLEEVRAAEPQAKKTTMAAVPKKSSEPQAKPLPERLRNAFMTFSNWCNRLDMDDRGFWI